MNPTWVRRITFLIISALCLTGVIWQILQADRVSLYPTAASGGGSQAGERQEWEDGQMAQLEVGKARLLVEIAASPLAQAKGLSGRESLADDAGMLFVHDELRLPTYWMKGMRYDLDLIWITRGVVREVTLEVPAEDAEVADRDLLRYSSSQPVDQVLEVRAGWVKRHGVKEGDGVVVNNDN